MNSTGHLFASRKVRNTVKALPIREPTFQVDNGAAGWVAKHYPVDQRERKAWLVLFFVAGFIDNNCPT